MQRRSFLKTIIPSRKLNKEFRKTKMKKNEIAYDAEELELLNEIENGEWEDMPMDESEKERFAQAAKYTKSLQAKIKKLKGEWKGFYRLRLRNYRVIYEKIQERLVIHIVRVAHRREVY